MNSYSALPTTFYALVLSLFSVACANGQGIFEPGQWHSHATLAIASDVVYQGVSLYDDGATADIRLTVQHQSGLFASLWVTRVELQGLFLMPAERQWQQAYDLGYSWQMNRAWSFSASHSWFQYSDSGASSYYDFDYRQWRIAAHYSDYASLLYTRVDEQWGFDNQVDSLSLILRYPFSASIVGELEWGQLQYDSIDSWQYPFARANLGYVHGQWSVQIQYHYSGSDAQQLFNNDRVGSQWLAKFAYHFTLL